MQSCPTIRQRPGSMRTGFTVIELTVSLILLGMLMTLIVPLIGTINKQQREAERRAVAVQLIDNMMERLTAEKYGDLSQSYAEGLSLSADDAAFFTNPHLSVSVEELEDGFHAKRITIRMTWNDSDGAVVSPAQVTSFVYPVGREI